GVVRGIDRGPVSAAHERGGVQRRCAEALPADSRQIRGTGRPRRARQIRRDQISERPEVSSASGLIRPHIRRLHGYVPGEQPKIPRLIKLNTNENPYPPSPRVLEAIKNAVDGRLRLYPNPTAERLRDKLAAFHD